MATTKEEQQLTKVVTGKGRFSYLQIWEARVQPGSTVPKFSVSFIIPKSDTKTINAVKAAIDLAYKQGTEKNWKGKNPNRATMKPVLRDGDADRPQDDAYRGCMFVNAKSTTAPGVIDQAKNPILDRNVIYSGCYGRVSLNFYPFGPDKTGGAIGIACGLNNLQKLADGEPLSGRSDPDADFAEDYADDASDIL